MLGDIVLPTAFALQGEREGNIDAVSLLLKHNADINIPDCDGNTPLSVAIKNDYMPIVQVLLSYKAEPNNGMRTLRF